MKNMTTQAAERPAYLFKFRNIWATNSHKFEPNLNTAPFFLPSLVARDPVGDRGVPGRGPVRARPARGARGRAVAPLVGRLQVELAGEVRGGAELGLLKPGGQNRHRNHTADQIFQVGSNNVEVFFSRIYSFWETRIWSWFPKKILSLNNNIEQEPDRRYSSKKSSIEITVFKIERNPNSLTKTWKYRHHTVPTGISALK